jgi:hypothetical protein
MANLSIINRQVLEKLFGMGSGYVLNFSDKTIREYFRDDLGIDIYDEKYNYASGSKANRMRGFWQVADDKQVGDSIGGLINYIDTQILLGQLSKDDYPEALMDRAKGITNRLLKIETKSPEISEDEFVSREFENISIDKLGLDSSISAILNERIAEIRKCSATNAPLAVIFLCGSTLEGILLGTASANPKDFNQSTLSPKDDTGKVKQFYNWTLYDFINVARDLNLLGEDVKKFSHALRDFRNYIHPFQQMASNFSPDQHTAKICWQVLQAAISDLSK